MVVKALYTSIPNNEGIAAVKRKHDQQTNKTVATKVLVDDELRTHILDYWLISPD